MPSVPYIINGNVKYNPYEGITSTIHTVATGGATINMYISSGSENYAGATITISNTTKGTSDTCVTDSSGNYSYDLQNLSTGYNAGDSITLTVFSITATSDVFDLVEEHSRKEHHNVAVAKKVIMVNSTGDEFTSDYPMPVVLKNDTIPNQNVEDTWTVRSDGQPTYHDIELPNGNKYRKEFTYNSDSILIKRSRWLKQ